MFLSHVFLYVTYLLLNFFLEHQDKNKEGIYLCLLLYIATRVKVLHFLNPFYCIFIHEQTVMTIALSNL